MSATTSKNLIPRGRKEKMDELGMLRIVANDIVYFLNATSLPVMHGLKARSIVLHRLGSA